jgi:hypothetical protein
MAARRPARRANASEIAAIARHHPGDPRLPQLRQQGEALKGAEELTAWAERYASALEPFASHEIAAIGHLAAVIDARVAGNAPAA